MTARLIKSADAARLAPILAPLELSDVHVAAEALLAGARRESSEILRNARDAADAIMTEARLEREKIARDAAALAREATEEACRQARDEGRMAGLEAGRREAFEAALGDAREKFGGQSRAAVELLNQLSADWNARRRQLAVEAQHDVVALAIAIARRIAPRLGELDSAIAGDTCAAALQLVGRAAEIVIRVNPDDAAGVKEFAADVLTTLESAGGVRWVEDTEMARGGVRLESRGAMIDATVQMQIDRICDELLAGWRDRVPVNGGTHA